jgi:type I restriction enzyme M protein
MSAGKPKVVFLNPRTCGIYKSGMPRYRTDPKTGVRTNEIDNELIEAVDAYLEGKSSPGEETIPVEDAFEKKVLVPTYYDERYNQPIEDVLAKLKVEGISLGSLVDDGVISVRGGHGSPGNDQRQGHIPYVKVSDIRGLRINVNPTNLVTEGVARRFWHGSTSGLKAWDLVTPNRASSNIGEFAILLPGEEEIVVTKEVFVFRVDNKDDVWDPFYLLWALSLSAVRDQWRRIALMQTNREDCGDRYREIIVPEPPSVEWAKSASQPFRDYFRKIAAARTKFIKSVTADELAYVANVRAVAVVASANAAGDHAAAASVKEGEENGAGGLDSSR